MEGGGWREGEGERCRRQGVGGGGGGKGDEKESVEDGESSCVPCCNMLAAEFCGQHRVYQAQSSNPTGVFLPDILSCSPITFSTGRYANLADGAVLVQVRAILCLDCDSWLTSIPYSTVANTCAIHAYIHQLYAHA